MVRAVGRSPRPRGALRRSSSGGALVWSEAGTKSKPAAQDLVRICARAPARCARIIVLLGLRRLENGDGRFRVAPALLLLTRSVYYLFNQTQYFPFAVRRARNLPTKGLCTTCIAQLQRCGCIHLGVGVRDPWALRTASEAWCFAANLKHPESWLHIRDAQMFVVQKSRICC